MDWTIVSTHKRAPILGGDAIYNLWRRNVSGTPPTFLATLQGFPPDADDGGYYSEQSALKAKGLT